MTGRGIAADSLIVGRRLGSDLYESMYQDCRCGELQHNGMNVRREVPLPIVYEDMNFDKGYMSDVIVDDTSATGTQAGGIAPTSPHGPNSDLSPFE